MEAVIVVQAKCFSQTRVNVDVRLDPKWLTRHVKTTPKA
jgi:hypothetical protein